ncbi:hypothetical protein B0H67DRAFT_476542 [Lasiosphaeris hirsuta]|uniref:C2H2-type domain-containing protein n=1 Tax=Lasiosphaeris hirsuta TaxID=260670 RepID=A0AA40E825_9PEZI|nr:hypothetical protein B0H67DRAFT_476542 [Lasiosphaeris hirsuta]
MSSTYTLYPSSVADSTTRRDWTNEPRSFPPHDSQHHIQPTTPGSGAHLSAFSPQLRLRSSSSSPALNTHTPADSSTLSINYQSSEFSESEDPFFGVNFGALDGGSPTFLDDQTLDSTPQLPQDDGYFPLSPDKTPSLHTTSPSGGRKGDRARFPQLSHHPVATQLPTLATQPSLESEQSGYQFTPETSGSGRSSDDGLAPAAAIMSAQSPRLTISMWGRDGASVPYPLDTDHHQGSFVDTTQNVPDYRRQSRDISASSGIRDGTGRWIPDQTTGQSGLDPENRPPTEVPSMNELAAKRTVDERNQEVDDWVTRHGTPSIVPPAPKPNDVDENLPRREIEFGAETENNMVSGQLYFTGTGGELTEEDVELIRQNRNWGDAPLFPNILFSDNPSSRRQPVSSQAAIEKFNNMCKDNDSIVSRAATWGTRRRSMPSIADFEGITSGNFLKKLSLSRGDTRRPSILQEIRGLVNKKPNTPVNKRVRSDNDEVGSIGTNSSGDQNRREPNLAPPTRTPSWNKKQGVPSINTALFAMGNGMASIGTTHARSGSVSASATPKSPSGFSLSVKKPLNRIRSKSDLTKTQTSSLADMWRKNGGPPVASLANHTSSVADADEDDDDDDELYEDAEMKTEANKIFDDITPNFEGFKQHILKLNHMLATTNTYLVDRIAHQQSVRYKSLLNARVKHLQCTAVNNCSCGPLCIDLGGSANILDPKNDRGIDPLSARYDGSDGDITPLEGPGVISQESFPPDIPMPPATILPAEFECQLCFQAKKFQKPSDWTKHVHEDVQPFTCTWDRCRDPKIFKRKADWVRHENEGHRHLEWWDCDVEDCRHVCYRRDNFLQHLVREHKYPEPKVKTKAAIKRAGGMDPTWQKVEQCHMETRDMPHAESCRFCGKSFPTWKKLTVHLAKHMEQISLPVLKLVARKDLEADTIISPVQEPPPRTFPASFPKSEPQYDPSPTVAQLPMSRGGSHIMYPTTPQQQQQPQHAFMYPIVPPNYQTPIYGNNFADMSPTMGQAMGQNLGHNMGQNMGQAPLNIQTSNHAVSHGFTSLNIPAFTGGMPVTSGGYMSTPQYISVTPDVEQQFAMNPLGLQDANVNVYSNNMMDPHSAGGDQYTPQGSVSPYAHSPHQPQGQFYGQ